jgi:hypothetical protein
VRSIRRVLEVVGLRELEVQVGFMVIIIRVSRYIDRVQRVCIKVININCLNRSMMEILQSMWVYCPERGRMRSRY